MGHELRINKKHSFNPHGALPLAICTLDTVLGRQQRLWIAMQTLSDAEWLLWRFRFEVSKMGLKHSRNISVVPLDCFIGEPNFAQSPMLAGCFGLFVALFCSGSDLVSGLQPSVVEFCSSHESDYRQLLHLL